MSESEQLLLPIEIRRTETVSWFKVIQFEKRRRLFANKIVTQLIINPETSLADTVSIPVEKINDLKDPDLRYALRFSAAAQAAGWEKSGHTSTHHDVIVEATDEGLDSRFVSATYTGIERDGVDDFMRNFHRFEPQPQVPGLACALVSGENGEPGTRYWVQQVSTNDAQQTI